MGEDDAVLLAAVSNGSERAFNLLVDRHQQAVRLFLRGLTSFDEAEDIAQETFLVVWRRAASFRRDASVRTWILGIAWRRAKSAQRTWFRNRQRESRHHEAVENIGQGVSPESRLALEQALAALPQDQRAAVTLCLGCGFSHSEAAEALGLPLGTVKSHVQRGREHLRSLLGGGL